MAEELLKYFKNAKNLNEEFQAELKTKKLHFRGNLGSFSLISLDRKTPEQGKGGFKEESQGREFLPKIEIHLSDKLGKIERGELRTRPTREKELQAWIINYAINNGYNLPFSSGLKFLTSELAFQKSEKKIVNDILAIDQEGTLVVVELKSVRDKKELERQVDDFCMIIADKKAFFKELVVFLAPERPWNGKVRKMIVWPDANNKTRADWENKDGVHIEEVRYKEIIGSDKHKKIVYNETDEIEFYY